MYTELFKN